MATASKSYTKSKEPIGPLMWPANLTDAFDYLQIDIVDYIPISQAVASSPQNSSAPSNPTPANSTSQFTGLIGGGLSNVQSSRKDAKIIKTVLLPVPENLNYADALKWNEESIGVKNKMAPIIAKNLVEGDVSGLTTGIQNVAKGGKVGIIIETIDKMGLNSSAVTQGIGGKVINPYTEQIFGGIGMRNFDLSWKLVPRSQSEQIIIHELIKELRRNALPDYSGSLTGGTIEGETDTDTLSDRWLTVPKIYRLSWRKPKGAELESLPKIKPCILKSVQVSYTPNNVWATHMVNGTNPYPVAYDLSLSFSEAEIITGKDVSVGY